MQAYQNYYYGNAGGDTEPGQNGKYDHDHFASDRHSGYTPPNGPKPESQAQAQSRGSAQVDTGASSQIDYGLSPEAQRMVAEEHFNNAILITLLVIGMLFFIYLWFFLSPLFRNRNLSSSSHTRHRDASLINPFTARNPRSEKVAPGALLNQKEGPGETSCASWKTFRPWSDEWSDISIKQAYTGHRTAKPPPLYSPRQGAKYPFAGGTSSNTTADDLLSVPRKLMRSVSLARDGKVTVPKRISHFFLRSFGSGAGSSASANSSGSLSTTTTLDGKRIAPSYSGKGVDGSYPFSFPSATSSNTTTTLLRPCAASRPSMTPVYERYSAFYGDGVGGANTSQSTSGIRSNNAVGSRTSKVPSQPRIPDHSRMGIAF
ncbi:hypothetical protein BJ165DRAFT_1401496 [Panaeolus papilionaceus]|nr:hypothetical protein BJ165DRAFT_1401496 [Panaeolus papilionaceus]